MLKSENAAVLRLMTDFIAGQAFNSVMLSDFGSILWTVLLTDGATPPSCTISLKLPTEPALLAKYKVRDALGETFAAEAPGIAVIEPKDASIAISVTPANIPEAARAGAPAKLAALVRLVYQPIFSTLFAQCRETAAAVPTGGGTGAAGSAAAGGSAVLVENICRRPTDTLYLCVQRENVAVAVSVSFSHPSDLLLCQLFLAELMGVRIHDRSLSGAVAATCPPGRRPTRPAVLARVADAEPEAEGRFWVELVLFKKHLAPEAVARMTDALLLFAAYLSHHLKCTKAYLHTRMRSRVEASLKVLARAKTPIHGRPLSIFS